MVMTVFDSMSDAMLSPTDRFRVLFGEKPESTRMNAGSGMLWVNYTEAYLESHKLRSKDKVWRDTVERTVNNFTKHIGLYNKRVGEVTQSDFERYIQYRSECLNKDGKPIGPVTLNNDIRILNALFAKAGPKMPHRWARGNLGIISVVPYMEKLFEPVLSPVLLDDSQLESFLDAAKYAKTPNLSVCEPLLFWSCALLIGSVTTLRRGALLAVERPSDHDLLVRRVLPVKADHMKNGCAETISLGKLNAVVDLLAMLPSKAGCPLLPWRRPDGTPLSLDRFTRVVKEIQDAAGIADEKRLKAKNFRSTAASRLLGENFSTDVARKRLGHRSEGIIQKHYAAHVVSGADRDASDVLAAPIVSMIAVRIGGIVDRSLAK